MQIEISLPTDAGIEYGVDGVMLWLKQLELAVHHAQKSVKEMDSMIREREGEGESPVLTGYLVVSGFEPNESEPTTNDTGTADNINIRIYEG